MIDYLVDDEDAALIVRPKNRRHVQHWIVAFAQAVILGGILLLIGTGAAALLFSFGHH